MNYYYIDESGDLGTSSKYFIIGGIQVNNPKSIVNIINKSRRRFKKSKKNMTEIKGYTAPPKLIKDILKKVNKTDCIPYIVAMDKSNMYKIKYKNKNHLYDIIASYLANNISIDSKSEFYIDKSKTRQCDIDNFNNIFINSLNNRKNYPITIQHVSSNTYKGLQVADLIVWSYFQHYEKNNSSFKELLKNTVLKEV